MVPSNGETDWMRGLGLLYAIKNIYNIRTCDLFIYVLYTKLTDDFKFL
jgi:hypothetical protein